MLGRKGGLSLIHLHELLLKVFNFFEQPVVVGLGRLAHGNRLGHGRSSIPSHSSPSWLQKRKRMQGRREGERNEAARKMKKSEAPGYS